MSFLKNLTKKKVRFDFYISIRYLLNLPTSLEGSSLLCQLKRKEKLSQTQYSLVRNSSVIWDDVLTVSMSMFVEKASHGEGTHLGSKSVTFCIKVSVMLHVFSDSSKWCDFACETYFLCLHSLIPS